MDWLDIVLVVLAICLIAAIAWSRLAGRNTYVFMTGEGSFVEIIADSRVDALVEMYDRHGSGSYRLVEEYRGTGPFRTIESCD